MPDGKLDGPVVQGATAVFPPSHCSNLKIIPDYPRGQLQSKNNSCYLFRLSYVSAATVLGALLSPQFYQVGAALSVVRKGNRCSSLDGVLDLCDFSAH